MKTITAVITEDEPLSSMYLTGLLRTWCANVEVMATVADYEAAIDAINRLGPQLIFLDIDLLNCTGFDVLKGLSVHYPSIIFTAAFGDATLNLIKSCGLPYLQKPIDGDELQAIVQKTSLRSNKLLLEQLQLLLQRLEHTNKPAVICVETADGCNVFINTAHIVCIEANGAECIFTLSENDTVTVVNFNLKDCESLLSESLFCRVSQKHIINLASADSFCAGAEPYVVMKNKLQIPVSAKKTEAVRSALS